MSALFVFFAWIGGIAFFLIFLATAQSKNQNRKNFNELSARADELLRKAGYAGVIDAASRSTNGNYGTTMRQRSVQLRVAAQTAAAQPVVSAPQSGFPLPSTTAAVASQPAFSQSLPPAQEQDPSLSIPLLRQIFFWQIMEEAPGLRYYRGKWRRFQG